MEPRSQAIEDPVFRVEIDRIDRNMRMLTAPVGTCELFLGPKASVPAGYSALDGGDLSRKENPRLFAFWGGKYGDGDGTTTFNKPSLVSFSLGSGLTAVPIVRLG